MFNLSLTACSFYFQKLHTRNVKDVLNLNDFISMKDESGYEKSMKAIDFFSEFFKSNANNTTNDYLKKTFKCEFIEEQNQGETDKFIYIYAKIFSGIYGSASEITDINTNEITHEKKATEADVRTFYLYIVFPKDNEDVKVQKGILFFQNIGAFGVKTSQRTYGSTAESLNLSLCWCS